MISEALAASKTESRAIQLEPSWKSRLSTEFETERMQKLRHFLRQEIQNNKKIYPPPQEWFAAFDLTPFDQVKVVIVGQDPYHGPGQAHGLCFSVRPGVAFPPSLQNIFKEMKEDVGQTASPKSGSLVSWAQQGVLLLNSVLTVEEGRAAAHQKKGWEEFTDAVIHHLNQEKSGIAFILWGAYAQKKGQKIDRRKHFVIESVHPSPLSSHRGFFGSRPFSKVNSYLESVGKKPIHWNL